MTTIVACPRDPEIETALRCSRCDTPICPKCLVQTPVGARCRECARMTKSPVYTVSGSSLAAAIAVALVGGVAMGLVWGFATRNVIGLGGLFSFFVGAGLGWAFTRMMDMATRRKRGPVILGCAIAGLVVAWLIQLAMVNGQILVGGLIALGVGVYWCYQQLR